MGNVDWNELLRWVPRGAGSDQIPWRSDSHEVSGPAGAADEAGRPAQAGG